MKKVLFFFSFLISCLSNAQEVIYSLPEINSKILQSSVLTPSGKDFLLDFFEFHAPLESDLGDLSQWVCEESASQKTKLFILSKRKCEENFELLLANGFPLVNLLQFPESVFHQGNFGRRSLHHGSYH